MTDEQTERHLAHTAKPITATGVNAAYLRKGEFAVSFGHSFCALIVLSNGRESFVTHLPTADQAELTAELKKVARTLGGEVTAQLYQSDIDRGQVSPHHAERLQRYIGALETVVGKAHLILHPLTIDLDRNRGDFFVTSEGLVESLTRHGRIQLERTFLPAGETFVSLQEKQSEAAAATNDQKPTSLFCYAPEQKTPVPHGVPKADLLREGGLGSGQAKDGVTPD